MGDWKQKTYENMNSETRKVIWRRQFQQLKKSNPEYVEETNEKMVIKYPIPGNMVMKYRTLTSFNLAF